MEERGEIKIRLSTVILLLLIIVLIGCSCGYYFYSNTQKENLENRIDLLEKNINEKELSKENENKKENINENKIEETIQFDGKETITANEKVCTIAYKNTTVDYMQEFKFKTNDTKIYFNGNEIISFQSGRYDEEIDKQIQLYNIINNNSKEYIVLKFISDSLYGDGENTYLYILNDEGEIIGSFYCDSQDGRNEADTGKYLKYEILKDGIELYSFVEGYSLAKYKFSVNGNGTLAYQVTELYPEGKVVFSGR